MASAFGSMIWIASMSTFSARDAPRKYRIYASDSGKLCRKCRKYPQEAPSRIPQNDRGWGGYDICWEKQEIAIKRGLEGSLYREHIPTVTNGMLTRYQNKTEAGPPFRELFMPSKWTGAPENNHGGLSTFSPISRSFLTVPRSPRESTVGTHR